MSTFPLGWKTLRWLGLLLITGCVALAAGHHWPGRAFSLEPATDWLSTFYSETAPRTEAPVAAEAPLTSRQSDRSMAELLDGLLFSRPAAGTGWRLDSAPAIRSRFGWLTQQETLAAPSPADPSIAQFLSVEPIAYSAALGALPNDPSGGPTTTGVWISNASGNWGTASNWQSGVIPNGNTARARFDTLNITTNVTVTNETPRTIGDLDVGDTDATRRYDITGSAITFESFFNSSALLRQISTSAGDTISAPLLLNQDLSVSNASTNVFTLSGTITSHAAPNVSTVIGFVQGNVDVTGNLSDGSGTALGVAVHTGTITFSGTNTYTRQTSITGGTLLVNGNNSGSTGTVFVSGEGSVLGGTGTIGADVFMSGFSTITGGTTTSVGTLTLLRDVNMVTGEGSGGVYAANLSGTMSDLLAITGQLVLGHGSSLNILGTADGISTYVLATFESHSDVFQFVSGIPTDYQLIYNQTNIELVPVPEPATWAGGALAAVAVALWRQRRKTETLRR